MPVVSPLCVASWSGPCFSCFSCLWKRRDGYGPDVIDGAGAPAPERGCPAEGEVVLVSACLLGVPCTHDAVGRRHEAVIALGRTRRLVPVCPEAAGGLPTPRPAAERSTIDGRVRTA